MSDILSHAPLFFLGSLLTDSEAHGSTRLASELWALSCAAHTNHWDCRNVLLCPDFTDFKSPWLYGKSPNQLKQLPGPRPFQCNLKLLNGTVWMILFSPKASSKHMIFPNPATLPNIKHPGTMTRMSTRDPFYHP